VGADFTSSFAIELKDETSGPAGKAASELASLKAKIDGDTKALREMQSAMARLKGGTSTSSTAFKELQDRIAASKASIASATGKYVDLGGAFGATAPKAEGLLAKLTGARAAVMALPAPVLAAASAWLAFAAAVAVGTLALLKYGIASSDARRAEGLRLEGLMTIRRWHGIAAGTVGELTGAIDRVAASSSIARSSVSGYAEQLYRAGLRGGTLRKALEAVTMTEQVQGAGRAARMAGMAISFARTGRSVDALAAKVKERLGGIAARQMLSLDVQTRKLEESFAFLTGGLRIEGLLSGLNEITQLFSANTASGRALKAIFEALFNPILDGIGGAGPLARRFFQGLVIAALHLTIGILQIGKFLRETFGGSAFAGVDKGSIALKAGMLALSLFAGAVIVTAAACGLLALALGLVVLSGLAIAAPFIAAGVALVWLGSKLDEAFAWAMGIDWSAAGASVIDGLVHGIQNGAARVVATVRGLAASAKGALVEALGIHSPSRVFAGLGLQIPRGLAVGVEEGAPSAQRAVDGLLRVPESAGAGGAAARSSGATSITINEVHVHATSNDPRDLAATFRDEVVRLLEGVAIEMGAQHGV